MCHDTRRSVFQAVLLHNIKVVNFKANGVGKRANVREQNCMKENDIMLWM